MKNYTPGKKSVATPEERVAEALKSKLSFELREEELRKNKDVDNEFIEEYKKTEVLRQSVKEVKARAKEEQDKRQNIKQVNSYAKSTVTANMKAVTKGKKAQAKEESSPQW